MAGGGSEDPTVLMKISLTFEIRLANSFNRFGITVYAILKNPKDK
jgi:hypothetical protein